MNSTNANTNETTAANMGDTMQASFTTESNSSRAVNK